MNGCLVWLLWAYLHLLIFSFNVEKQYPNRWLPPMYWIWEYSPTFFIFGKCIYNPYIAWFHQYCFFPPLVVSFELSITVVYIRTFIYVLEKIFDWITLISLFHVDVCFIFQQQTWVVSHYITVVKHNPFFSIVCPLALFIYMGYPSWSTIVELCNLLG